MDKENKIRSRDIPPPDNLPLLEWGDALPMRWKTREDGTVYILPSMSFMTKHGSSIAVWRADRTNGPPTGPYAAYHVKYPDGGIGHAFQQQSGLGMVDMNRRPWRRLLEGGKSWWPGEMTIFKDKLVFTDHESLLKIWIPTEKQVESMKDYELAGRSASEHLIWPEMYIDLTKNEQFMERVRHDDFAADTFTLLLNRKFKRKADNKLVVFASERRFGDLLGAWRRCGESYLDFFHNCGPGNPTDKYHEEIIQLFYEAGYSVT